MTSAPGFPPDGEIPSPGSEGGAAPDLTRPGASCPLSATLEASPDPALVATTTGIRRRGQRGLRVDLALRNSRAARRGEPRRHLRGRRRGAARGCCRIGGPSRGTGERWLGDGSEIELRLSARRLRDPASSDERLVVFASDVTAARRLERAAAVLGTTLDAGPVDGFFDRLTAGLADTLRMEMVVVGRLEEGEPPRVRTLAVRAGGSPAEPFTYELHGAPCEQVVGRVPCVFQSRVAELFPEDPLLSQNGLSSYVGVPLTTADGSSLGLLAALSRRPLHDGESAARALGLFAARAVAEIERREARLDEGRREEESRRLVASIPVGLHRYRLEGDGRLVFVGANPAADAILGVDNRQFVGRTIEEAFPALVGTRVPEAYRRAAIEGAPWRSEEVTYADGRIAGAFLVQAFQTAPVGDGGGVPRHLGAPARRGGAARTGSAPREAQPDPEDLRARPGDPRRGTGAGRADRARLRGARRGPRLRLRLGRPAGRAGERGPPRGCVQALRPGSLPDRPQDSPRRSVVRQGGFPEGNGGPGRFQYRATWSVPSVRR